MSIARIRDTVGQFGDEPGHSGTVGKPRQCTYTFCKVVSYITYFDITLIAVCIA